MMNTLYLNTRRYFLQKLLPALALTLFLAGSSRAQLFNVPVTGFNSDQVANGTGVPTTTTTAATDGAVDDGGYTFIDGTYQYNATCALPTTNILPANGQISSSAATGLIYQLQAYSGNNALRVPATGRSTGSGTLFFNTPVSVATLYLLSVSGGGAITSGITVTVKFTDSSTQVFSNQSTTDWCNTTSSGNYTKITTTQYNRIQATTVSACGGFGTCQYFAEMTLNIDGANYHKQVAYVTIDKTTTTNVMNVYAVGAKAPCAAPSAQPTALLPTLATTSSITASFTDASPLPSGYLVVRYPQGASTITPPGQGITYTSGQLLGAGTVVSAGSSTTFTASALSGGTTYDFYIYSYNTGTACGGPVYLTASPLFGSLSTNSCGTSIGGTISVGPGGTYSDLTTAIAAISGSGLATHTVLELLPGYSPASETFPITFPVNPCISSTKTLTIRPSIGVSSPLIISSNNGTATIDLNGAAYVSFDGRPGGTGFARMLSLVNTSATGVAIRFINDASNNTVTYCDVQGENTSAASSGLSGVIYFSTANSTLMNGNDNNTISYCDIHATPTGYPAIGIASYGSNVATPATAWNENNTIDHCNIYDFFSPSLASTGIKLDGGSHAFTISSNRLFQTATRTFTTGNQQRAFWLTPTTSGACGFQVTDNFIGGSDSLGNGVWTLAGSVTTNFWGMDINHTGVIPTSVQGNTITRISLTSTTTTANDLFRGISTGNTGHVYIGTVSGNIIGSPTANGAITLVTSGSGSSSYGIKCGSTSASTDTIRVHNNMIGGIQVSSSTSTSAAHLYGIGVTTGSYTHIDNNLIGSLVTPNSLNNTNSATATQVLHGISVAAGIYTTVTNNTIANITNNFVGTSTTAYTRGIYITASTTSVVSGNTVKNIVTHSTGTGSTTTAALTGIQVSSSNPSTITRNTVDSLVLGNPVATSASVINGIYVSLNGSAPTHEVSRNTVAHLHVANPGNTNAIINGMEIAGGSNIIANNMIQLGIKADGTPIDTPLVMRGLHLNTTTATQVYHNTVYIGGTNIGVTQRNTVAFNRAVASGTHDVRNNIFVNERSNATTGGKHYQVFLNNTTGLSLSNNVYYGTGTGSVMGTFNNGSSDVLLFTSGWLNTDTASVSGDPRFINPAGGNAASVSPLDLHISTTLSTPVESSGRPVAIAGDYDGDDRSNNTPVDIGADAGLFIPIGMSIDSTVVVQVTSGLPVGAQNQAVVAVRVYAKGSVSPLTLTALKLNTSGTTDAANDLQNARVYYTGPSVLFSTGNQYGATVASPNGTFYVSGAQVLSPGLNCFWVAYDTRSTATANNFIDARLDSVGLSGNAPANILNGDPAGARKISAPLAGPYNVGVGHTYETITDAIADLGLLGVSAPVTFLLKDASYSANETFPLTFTAIQGSSPFNTVTIMPDFGVTATISANIASPVIRLDGVRNLVIDGRQGGTGSSRSLTVTNDNTGGAALTFINDASRNTLQYTTFRGASTNTVIGVINFATGVTTGNDSNLVDHCAIGDAVSLPTTLIQARGSLDATSKFNTGNVISNCELFNFWHASSESNAMKISKGNAGWTIRGNSIYQTASRAFSAIHYSFNWNRIVDDAGNTNDAMGAASLVDMVIEDNYLGGSGPMCSGAPWTESGSGGAFCSYFNMGDSGMNYIRRNTFCNFEITGTQTGPGAPGAWNAIQFIGGKLMIDSNLIGSVSDTSSISIVAGNGNVVFPIACTGGSSGNFRINGNVIGGIRAGGNGTTALNIQNIFISNSSSIISYDVEYNHVGILPVKLLGTTGTSAQVNHGIYNTGSAPVIIRNNIVHNLYNEQSSTGITQVIGVRSTNGVTRITGNLIDSLQCFAQQTGTAASASVIGVMLTSGTGGSLVENNRLTRFHTLNPDAVNSVSGIYYAGGNNDVIARNMIHTFGSVSSPAALAQNGIQVNGGTVRVQNNMVRFGIDAAGTAQADSSLMTGILISGGNARVFFNTVYIGGTGASGNVSSFAFNRTSGGTDSVYNNVFVNERFGFTSTHYAVGLSNSNGLRSNYNLFFNPGGTSLGLYNGVTQATVTQWKQASGVDGNSNAGNPSMINPAGDIATLSLHISTSGTTPIEGSGMLITGIEDDYDGDARSSNTPTDIGADAGNFTPSDIFAPAISYSNLLPDTVHTVRVLNGFATITDASGVDVSGNPPRIYYKKTTDNDAFVGNSMFDNGWKYVTASNSTSPFSFTIDYTILNGGSVLEDDTIQYFVVAQDLLGNVGANPAGGFQGISVSFVSTAPAAPSFYRIKGNPLNGNYNVGVGQTAPNFASITAAVGKLNDVGVSGPVTFTLLDAAYNTGETFPITINQVQGSGSTGTVTIKPAASVTSAITGSASAIFILNGADHVIIDGSNNGTSSRDLSITNQSTATNSAVIWVQTSSAADAATNNQVKNVLVSGNSRTSTLAGIGFGGTTIGTASLGNGNHNNSVVNCKITKAQVGIYSFGNSAAAKNNGTVISGNELNELSKVGIYAGFENNLLIEKNTIRDVLQTGNTVYGISLGTITGNSSAPTGSEVTNATVSKNVIDSIVTTAGWSSHGMMVTPAGSGTHRITDNMISRVLGGATPNDFVAAVYLGGGAASTQFLFNTVYMSGTHNTSRQNYALAVGGSDPVMDIRNNILVNNATGGSSGSFAIGFNYSAFNNLVCDYNNYVNTGSNAQFAATGGLFGGASQTTLAALRLATGKDASSKNVAVNFISAGDLHLGTGSNGDVNLIAVPVAGYTTDIDEDTRGAQYPYMGADEASIPLPVRLAGFTAVSKGDDVLVSWVTAGETNNKGFYVERSVDGKAFEDAGFVEGAGNTANIAAYSFTDRAAFSRTASGVLYYRLRQIDMDGAESRSETVVVVAGKTASASDIAVYPNPFSDKLSIRLFTEQAATVSVQLFDLGGRMLNATETAVSDGLNILEVPALAGYDKGIYFVKVSYGTASYTTKVVKAD